MFNQLTDLTKAFIFYGIAFALAVAVMPLQTILGETVLFVTMFTPLISVLLMLLVVC